MVSVMDRRSFDHFSVQSRTPAQCRAPVVQFRASDFAQQAASKPFIPASQRPEPVQTDSADSSPTASPVKEVRSKMLLEVQHGASWWRNQAEAHVSSSSQLATFEEELIKILMARFEGHWYPDEPRRGHAFRCIVNEARCDSALTKAAEAAGIKDAWLKFPIATMWISPDSVSVKTYASRWDDNGELYQLYPMPETSL
mmetsp:Transcript_7585/g.17400  ORF Transcript_7585/g.17400 Transcript_7585/m.17400 type:complete len:198 (+) Transcript_7585:58-651(+)